MAALKIILPTLSLTYFLLSVTAQSPEIVNEPVDQTKDEKDAVFMTCEVQYLDRNTHVVSWLLGDTIISDDGNLRKSALDDIVGDGASDRYQLTISIIPPEPRVYVFELFITSAEGADNGGEFRCAVCPKDSVPDGICNGNLEVESRAAELEIMYRPDTSVYPKCINPSNSPSETVVVLGVETTLTCESEIANPPVNLEWRKNGEVVSGTMPPDTTEMRRLDYDMIPTISDEGSLFTCTVSSDYFNDLTDVECSLPRIKVVSIPSVTLDAPGEIPTGRAAEYTCSATSETGATIEDFSWDVEDLSTDRYTVSHQGSTSTLRITKTQLSDHGKTVTCSVTDSDNQVGEGSAMILIKGQPPPTGATPPTVTDPRETDGPENIGLIVGVAVTGVILLILIIAFIFWCCKKRRSTKSKSKKPVGTTVIAMEQTKPYSISADVSHSEKSKPPIEPFESAWADEPEKVSLPSEKRTGSPDGVDPRHWWNEKMAPESDHYTPDGQSYPPSHQDGDFNNPGYDIPEYRPYDDRDMDDQRPYNQDYDGYPEPARYDDRLQGYGDDRPYSDQDFSNPGYEGSYPSGLDAGRGEHYEPYGYPDRMPDGQEGSPPESSVDYYPDNYGNHDNYANPDNFNQNYGPYDDNYGHPDDHARPDDYVHPDDHVRPDNYARPDDYGYPDNYNSPDNSDGYRGTNYGQYNPEDYGSADNYRSPDNYGNPQYPEDQYYDDRDAYPNNNTEFYPSNDEQYPPSSSDQYPPSEQYPPSDAYPGSDPYDQERYEQPPPPGSPGYDQAAEDPADPEDDAYNSMGTPSYV